MQVKRIYIDLDTLLDTRLGVLDLIDPEAAKTVCRSEEYWLREYNDWFKLTGELVTEEVFEEHWNNRNNDVLFRSVTTAIIPVLHAILLEYNKAKREEAVEYELVLEVNVAPYTLSVEELDELKDILNHDLLYEDLVIEFVEVLQDELTPEFIGKRYSAMLMYDFHRWVKLHFLSFKECYNKGLTVIVPRLFDKDPVNLSIEQKKEEITTFKLWFIEHLELRFIDSGCFSMFRPNVAQNAPEGL